jgi:hypothetical protein
LSLVDPLPPGPSSITGRSETTIEIARPIHASDDRVERYDSPPDEGLSLVPQCRNDLVERQHHVDVIGLAAQQTPQAAKDLLPPCPLEVIGGVC